MGDMIVCFADQSEGLLHKPLNQVLEANLDAPLLILSDLYPPRLSRSSVLSLLMLWAGLLGIVAGSFLFQFRIMSLPSDGLQTTLLLCSVFTEFWLLWIWSHLFR